LQRGQRAYKPTSLALLESWRDVQEYAHSHASRDLLPAVQIIDREGTGYLRQLLSGVTTDEAQADYVASSGSARSEPAQTNCTAGWPQRVRIGNLAKNP
jgi:hypothetical protein